MSKYQAVFFPDPYNIGVRDVIIKDKLLDLLQEAFNYYKRNNDCPYLFRVLVGRRWQELPRSVYREFNKMLGRF